VAGGVEVMTRGDVLDLALKAREHLVASGVPSALAALDPALWGWPAETGGTPPWAGMPAGTPGGDLWNPSRTRFRLDHPALLATIEELVTEARYGGLDHIVLIGMGSASLAAAAITAEADGDLTIIDDIEPAALRRALARLDHTLVVLADKRSGTIEVDSHRRIFAQAFRDAGLSEWEVARRFVIVTDAGSPWEAVARKAGNRLVLTDPELPGHYGALSAYGLVAAALAGADVTSVIESARAAIPSLSRAEDNPGLLLGAILGGCLTESKDKLLLHAPGTRSPLGGWLEQLLAGALGKRGHGILPIDTLREPSPDAHSLALNPKGPPPDADTIVWGALGAQFLTWEYAAAVAAWLVGVDPFEATGETMRAAENDTLALLTEDDPLDTPSFAVGGIGVHLDPLLSPAFDAFGGLSAGAPGRTRAGIAGAVESLLRAIPSGGYLTIVSYLGREHGLAELEPRLAERTLRPVTFSAAPGHLYRAGPYHTDGPRTGVFLVISGHTEDDLPIPGTPYTLGGLRLARAAAEVRTLRRAGLPALHIHLRDPATDAPEFLRAVRT
jgi:hypothetical protein